MVVKWAMRGNFTLSGTKASRPKVENNTSLAQATSLGTWKQLVLNAAQTSALLLAPSSPGNLVRGRPCNVLFIRESIDPNHKDTVLPPTPVINLLAMSTNIICSVPPPSFFLAGDVCGENSELLRVPAALGYSSRKWMQKTARQTSTFSYFWLRREEN